MYSVVFFSNCQLNLNKIEAGEINGIIIKLFKILKLD